jgi:glutathione S-transferase
MPRPQLHGTPLSHFTRKIRILLAELEVPFDFVRPTSILGTETATYGDNPLMRVPTLVHDGATVIESDHIARYLVGRYDPEDRFGVRRDDVRDLNRLAVLNGIMANEVVVILAKRGGLADVNGVAYFRKLLVAIDTALAWLDGEIDPDRERFDYVDMATIAMWEHAVHYQLAQGLERYPRIAARVARFAARPSVATTTPEASLVDARAAGWASA